MWAGFDHAQYANIAQATVGLEYCIVCSVWSTGVDGIGDALAGVSVEE